MSVSYADLNLEIKRKIRDVLIRFRNDKEMYETAKNRLTNIFNTYFGKEDLKKKNISVLYSCSRVKDEDSILKKIIKKSLEEKKDFGYEDLTDLVGIRLICLSTSDVRRLKDEILNSSDIEKATKNGEPIVKDYLTNEKDSGYRGIHIIVNVPIDYKGNKIKVPCEIQLRTILMDIYATAEHANYKKSFEGKEKEKIKNVGKKLNDIEDKFDRLHSKYVPSEEVVVDERVKREFDKLRPLYDATQSIAEYRIRQILNKFETKYPNSLKYMRSRIKPVSSVTRKIRKHGYEISEDSIIENVKDAVGFNIVCYDIKDLDQLLLFFITSLGTEMISYKNYVAEPKESGYEAFHIIISVPVYGKNVPVEIQLKSMLMEAWSLHDDYLYGTTKPEDYQNELKRMTDDLKLISATLAEIKENEKKTKPESIVEKLERESKTVKTLRFEKK